MSTSIITGVDVSAAGGGTNGVCSLSPPPGTHKSPLHPHSPVLVDQKLKIYVFLGVESNGSIRNLIRPQKTCLNRNSYWFSENRPPPGIPATSVHPPYTYTPTTPWPKKISTHIIGIDHHTCQKILSGRAYSGRTDRKREKNADLGLSFSGFFFHFFACPLEVFFFHSTRILI